MEEFNLPESTFTLLITEEIFSKPLFNVGLIVWVVSVAYLSLVLRDEMDNRVTGNKFNILAGLSMSVRLAQHLGLIIGENVTARVLV
jgi:hypothetical protein